MAAKWSQAFSSIKSYFVKKDRNAIDINLHPFYFWVVTTLCNPTKDPVEQVTRNIYMRRNFHNNRPISKEEVQRLLGEASGEEKKEEKLTLKEEVERAKLKEQFNELLKQRIRTIKDRELYTAINYAMNTAQFTDPQLKASLDSLGPHKEKLTRELQEPRPRNRPNENPPHFLMIVGWNPVCWIVDGLIGGTTNLLGIGLRKLWQGIVNKVCDYLPPNDEDNWLKAGAKWTARVAAKGVFGLFTLITGGALGAIKFACTLVTKLLSPSSYIEIWDGIDSKTKEQKTKPHLNRFRTITVKPAPEQKYEVEVEATKAKVLPPPPHPLARHATINRIPAERKDQAPAVNRGRHLRKASSFNKIIALEIQAKDDELEARKRAAATTKTPRPTILEDHGAAAPQQPGIELTSSRAPAQEKFFSPPRGKHARLSSVAVSSSPVQVSQSNSARRRTL